MDNMLQTTAYDSDQSRPLAKVTLVDALLRTGHEQHAVEELDLDPASISAGIAVIDRLFDGIHEEVGDRLRHTRNEFRDLALELTGFAAPLAGHRSLSEAPWAKAAN